MEINNQEQSEIKKSAMSLMLLFAVGMVPTGPAFGQSPNGTLQRRIEQLENRLKGMEEMLRRYEQGEAEQWTSPRPGDVGGVRGLEERLGELERIVEGVELSGTFAAREDLIWAVKYEGSDDCGNFLPEKQYGAGVSYSLSDNVGLSLEYLTGEFENDDERDQLTSQLAIEW